MKSISRKPAAKKIVELVPRSKLTPDKTARQLAHTKHGGKGTRLYSVWKNMRRRCLTPTHPDYPKYGGRGISICKRWDDFALFREDMGEPPSDKHTLDRRRVNGNYCKSNCRWATSTQQNRNRTNNRIVTYMGREMPLVEAAELAGVPYKRVTDRLYAGMSLDDALRKGRYK